MAPLLRLLLGTLATTNNDSSIKPPISLEVCLSPGCVADGGKATFQKCKALAPPNLITIEEGGCVSACGNGPVLRENEKIVHKQVNDVVSLFEELLSNEKNGSDGNGDVNVSIPIELIQGYEDVLKANEAMMEQNKMEEAISLYEKGIDTALDVALLLSKKNALKEFDELDDSNSNKMTPPNLQWIVRAFCALAEAKLRIKDYDGALEAANKACEISYNSDPICWEVVAQICQECNDPQREMKALQTVFAISESNNGNTNTLPRDVANRRRSQGFRLAKLERENAKE
jgi:tetratricopeptide (TPR) repeat protein